MLSIRKAADRGAVNMGWLDSRHSFSFGHYHDPEHMGFSSLRVLNDDRVNAGAGFDKHGHRDMEIISYVLSGRLQHEDSTGNVKILPAGEFQLMSAGKGIYHSEFNASQTEPVHFLQIWIAPETLGQQPKYQQKDFGQAYGLTTIATPDGENNTLQIKQQAKLHQLILPAGEAFEFQQHMGSKLYLHQVSGDVFVADQILSVGDGAKIAQNSIIKVSNQTREDSTTLMFELP